MDNYKTLTETQSASLKPNVQSTIDLKLLRISPSAQYKTCRPLCQLHFLFWKISKHSSNLERTLGLISVRSHCTRRVSARQLGRPATEFTRHAVQNLRRAFTSLPTDRSDPSFRRLLAHCRALECLHAPVLAARRRVALPRDSSLPFRHLTLPHRPSAPTDGRTLHRALQHARKTPLTLLSAATAHTSLSSLLLEPK